MSKKKEQQCCNQFKTTIGGQALMEGIMMRGPEKDAIAVRSKGEITLEITPRKVRSKKSPLSWPLIRGPINFFDSQVVGVKALMRSVDLSPVDEQEQNPSKFDRWLEKKLGNERFQKVLVGGAVFFGLGLSIVLFFLLPMLVVGFLDQWVHDTLVQNLIEGGIRMLIFLSYMVLIARMNEMKRVFAYHGAEHKTIRCYELGLPLTVENVKEQTRLHPRCGTSFLLVVMVISILVFSVASTLLLLAFPVLEAMKGGVPFRFIMIGFKLLLLPVVVAITYEINRWAGRHDNWFTKILTAPGLWLQKLTTNEPDDEMIEVAITAVEAVIPEEAGADRW